MSWKHTHTHTHPFLSRPGPSLTIHFIYHELSVVIIEPRIFLSWARTWQYALFGTWLCVVAAVIVRSAVEDRALAHQCKRFQLAVFPYFFIPSIQSFIFLFHRYLLHLCYLLGTQRELEDMAPVLKELSGGVLIPTQLWLAAVLGGRNVKKEMQRRVVMFWK